MADPRHLTGLAAEEAVAHWLSAAGWHVLERRCRPAAGAELDIVALDPRGVLVGIECRARRSDRAGSPAESVDGRRVARLRRAVAAYAATSGVRHRGLRIDLVSARPEPGGAGRWRLARVEGIG
jgi:Holliday junction resolvase-like predicted endonuclease